MVGSGLTLEQKCPGNAQLTLPGQFWEVIIVLARKKSAPEMTAGDNRGSFEIPWPKVQLTVNADRKELFQF